MGQSSKIFTCITDFFTSISYVSAQEDFYRKYLRDYPVEQVYVHTDKDVFFLDTDIKFKAYVRCINPDLEASEEVNIIILNFKGEEMYRGSYPLAGGSASGSIRIEPEWNYGEYKIKAFTKRSLRSAYTGLFERVILIRDYRIPSIRIQLDLNEQVYSPGDFAELGVAISLPNGKPAKYYSFDYSFSQNGNIYRFGESTTDRKGKAVVKFLIPDDDGLSLVSAQVSSDYNDVYHSNSIVATTSNWPVLLSFFPEGGRLVEEFESRIVFSATNVFDEPIMIEADLIDDYGKKIGEIKTDYPGLGCFTINPDIGNPLIVKVTEPYETFREFPLPEIQDEGIVMKVMGNGPDRSILIDHNYDLESIKAKLLAESGGLIVWEKEIDIRGKQIISLPLDEFPKGLSRISLLSDEFGLLAQRPILVNNQENQIEGELEVAETGLSKKGQLIISNTGEPNIPGMMSISVVDDIVCPDLMINPDIYSSFILGQTINHSPFPPGFAAQNDSLSLALLDMFVSTRLNTNVFYELGVPDNLGLSDEVLLQEMLEKENPGAMEQLLSVIRADQFMQEFIFGRGEEIVEFLAVNNNKLVDMEIIPGMMTEAQLVSRLLEIGTPLLSIVKKIQPVYISNEYIYFRIGQSLSYDPRALIVIDGIPRGYRASILETTSPYSVDSVRVLTTVAEVLKYDGLNSAGGIIEIVTKKGKPKVAPEDYVPKVQYDPTLFWYPDFNSKIDPETIFELPYPKLRTKYRLVVQGVDAEGIPIYYQSPGSGRFLQQQSPGAGRFPQQQSPGSVRFLQQQSPGAGRFPPARE